jgi:hypothetical protein
VLATKRDLKNQISATFPGMIRTTAGATIPKALYPWGRVSNVEIRALGPTKDRSGVGICRQAAAGKGKEFESLSNVRAPAQTLRRSARLAGKKGAQTQTSRKKSTAIMHTPQPLRRSARLEAKRKAAAAAAASKEEAFRITANRIPKQHLVQTKKQMLAARRSRAAKTI